MTYTAKRYETLKRLGIEQLPPLHACSTNESDTSDNTFAIINPLTSTMPIRERPVPGRRCPTCAARGATVWVIPGKRCPSCGTEV
ncbi:hypothetical protein CB0940_01211 [Cercospora beticola]|uniref:Uncharacterized protein n=1 Tax=Cercospora beticola TaxID=122368 RepID=A0A2G5I7L0_CERBT|nr:hypothetical protein CB0940_01211 [Cercospora beticola]PIB00770.1 hypothetical protein CB0940_01211 [Cercospora beticola]WPA96641.1 hypothetical protein RHO25_001248 [Cercospora beticola]